MPNCNAASSRKKFALFNEDKSLRNCCREPKSQLNRTARQTEFPNWRGGIRVPGPSARGREIKRGSPTQSPNQTPAEKIKRVLVNLTDRLHEGEKAGEEVRRMREGK